MRRYHKEMPNQQVPIKDLPVTQPNESDSKCQLRKDLIRVLLIELRRRCLDEIMRNDPDWIFSQPNSGQKQQLRYYTDFGRSHVTGVLIGAIWWGLNEPLNDSGDMELSPVELAIRFNAEPVTIRQSLYRLCANGWLEKIGRNRYRATDQLRERLNDTDEPYQNINNDQFIDRPDETPRTLAIEAAGDTARSDADTARRFGVHRSTVHRMKKQSERNTETVTERNKNRTERNTETVQNATKTVQNATTSTCIIGLKTIGELDTCASARKEKPSYHEDHAKRVKTTG